MPDSPPAAETKQPPTKEPESSVAAPAASPVEKKPKTKRYVVIGAVALLLVAGGLIALRFVHRGLPEGLIQANGRIEGDRVSVASKFPGRIARLLVREGDSVTNGQVLALLEDTQLQAKVSQAQAAVTALAAQLKAAQTSLEVMKLDVPLGIEIADAGVAKARAVLAKATAGDQQAGRDAKRFRELLATGSVDNHRSEMSELAATAATSELEAGRTGLIHAEKQLAQFRLGEARIQAQSDGVAALAAQLDQGRAVQAEAESVLHDLTLVAPISGIITTRVRDTGEVIAAGSPVFDLVNLDRLYLKVYVPESQIGKLRLDLPARIHIDALPDQSFPATARYIASRAEFTPKEVQTPDERVKLVYAVKLYLTENPNHRLAPGLPADAVIRWQEGIAWQNPKW
ncbi:MAG: efflux RND transporter periplasmic adaptor subunit [Verrucomicrobia bacterium]|nr:efflux RND transporter periplasmic adaptor subunit [Verrucomicrobiota bacterium]